MNEKMNYIATYTELKMYIYTRPGVRKLLNQISGRDLCSSVLYMGLHDSHVCVCVCVCSCVHIQTEDLSVVKHRRSEDF